MIDLRRAVVLPSLLLAVSCSSSTPEPVATADAASDDGSVAEGSVEASSSDASGDGANGEAAACVPGADPTAKRSACGFVAGALPHETLGTCLTGSQIPVDHIVLLMQENRSFDYYLGHLKGHGQDDVDVAADDASNPAVAMDGGGAPSPGEAGAGDAAAADGGDPGDARVAEASADPTRVLWHHLTDYCFDDTNHEWGPSHLEYDDGKNDGFVAQNAGANDALGFDLSGSRAMGYYDATDIPFYYALASTFAISDRYFSELLGPTFPNRRFFYGASSYGQTQNDLDNVDYKTIFGALNERNISWKIYRADVPGAFVFHSIVNEGGDRVVDISEFAKDAAAGTLPQVSWVDPQLLTNVAQQTSEHPPADMQVGQHFVYEQVKALMASPNWPSSVMFITYDEHGGLFDHVPPPPACAPDDTPPTDTTYGGFDRYGFRVPVFVVSPFARGHFVSHVVHSHSSILRFVETKFDLPALSKRDANSDAMLDMLDFEHPQFLAPPALAEPPVDANQLQKCIARYTP